MAIAAESIDGIVALFVCCSASMATFQVGAQSQVDGYWNPLSDEDYVERYPGPDQGEYAGLPVTDAAVSVAESYSPELLTEEHTQCRPHPSIYGFRGLECCASGRIGIPTHSSRRRSRPGSRGSRSTGTFG